MGPHTLALGKTFGLVASVGFWLVMYGVADGSWGPTVGYILAWGFVIAAAPVLVFGPLAPLAGIVAVYLVIKALVSSFRMLGPILVLNLIGFAAFAARALDAVQRAL